MTSLYTEVVDPFIRRQLAAGTSIAGEAIHTRGSDRGGLFRVPLPAGGSVVVKVWRTRSLKERLKVYTGISNARHEWRMHRMLFQCGVDVPEPLAFRRMETPEGQAYEAMVIEDLGDTTRALSRLKELIEEGTESEVETFEDRLIDETSRLVRLRVLDTDHQLNNFVVDKNGRLMRVDFECARRYPLKVMPQVRYAKMLARFITGHIHAVQPDVERSVQFVNRLYARLHVPRRVRSMVRARVNRNLEDQFNRRGILTSIQLPV